MAGCLGVDRDDGGCIQMATQLGADDARRLVGGFRDCARLALDASVQALDRKPLEPNIMMARSEHAQAAVAVTPAHKPSRYWEVFSVVFVLVLLLGVATPIALLIWQSTAATGAVRSGSAGTFVSATASHGGFFSSALTNVQTNDGSVVVRGTFSAPRGRVLAVEELNKTGLHLCAVGDRESCLPLAGHWAGPLAATPQASRVFDFVGHGLDRGNLAQWLAAGLIVAFTAFACLLASAVVKKVS